MAPSKRGPAQRIYQHTAAGKKQLNTWLSEGAHTTPLKSTLLAQLWFLGDAGDKATSKMVLTTALAEWRRWQASLNSIYQSIEKQPSKASHPRFNQFLTLTFGLSSLAANIRWAENALAAWPADENDKDLATTVSASPTRVANKPCNKG